jgi:hypothetical protein
MPIPTAFNPRRSADYAAQRRSALEQAERGRQAIDSQLAATLSELDNQERGPVAVLPRRDQNPYVPGGFSDPGGSNTSARTRLLEPGEQCDASELRVHRCAPDTLLNAHLPPLKLNVETSMSEQVAEYVDQTGRRHVVLELRGCDNGPPLVLVNGAWSPSDPASGPVRGLAAPLSMYLAIFAREAGVTVEAADTLDDRILPRYQCAVPTERWRAIWSTIVPPFLQMRTAYRALRRSKNAPNLWFGVPPRFLYVHSS